MAVRGRITSPYAPSATLKPAVDAMQAAANAYSGADTFWEHPSEVLKGMFTKFKAEIKDTYFCQQGFMCCYCCLRLAQHKGSYDLEHVIGKKKFPNFMFESRNLAAICKTCNSAKNDSDVLSPAGMATLGAFPAASSAYLVVHPHFDEWGDHLHFDSYGRIEVNQGSDKGEETFDMCKFERQNILAIGGYFLSADKQDAIKFLNHYFDAKKESIRRKYLGFLNGLAVGHELETARTLLRELSA